MNSKIQKLRNHFFLPAFLREMKNLRVGGMSGGNRITLIIDGDSCFREFLKALRSARHSINLESYIFKSDDVGWMIARELAEKAARGIEVNVMYDAVGSLKTSQSIFTFLREHGVEVLAFNPLIPWRKIWNISFRDHRKILVVDGRVAFVGGINIGQEYAGPAFNGGDWRDTHLKIEGPAVKDIQFFFVENWFRNGGEILDNKLHFPELREKGRNLLMVLCTKNRKKIKPINESYISAINNARSDIRITNAYFIPDAKIYRALVRAAERGVDVRLILPGVSDVPVVKHASRYLYKRYLKHGIRVYEYQRNILHAKTAVIDGIWSTVGSSNLDRRSFRKNLEINVVVLDQEFGDRMEEVFFKDLEYCREVTLETMKKRSLRSFVIQWICYRFRNLL